MNDQNRANPPGDDGVSPVGGAFGVDDVFFTLFRHKWLILSFLGLGMIAAVVVRIVKPPLYQSNAKLSVPYVVDAKAVNTADPETQIISTGGGGLAMIEAEIQILKSLDVCVQVAESVGPEKILAKLGGGNDRMAAASVILAGISVEPPRTATIDVTFQNLDPELVQPVLNALIKAYAVKHRQVHTGEGVWDEFYIAKRDEYGKKLAETEEQLRRMMSDAKMVSVAETKESYQLEIAKLQSKLFDAETELAQRKALMGNLDLTASVPGDTNAPINAVPPETLDDYLATAARLQFLVEDERRMQAEGLKEAHPRFHAAREERLERTAHKAALEQKYPALTDYAAEPVAGTTNSPASAIADVRRLTTSVQVLETLLSNVQFQVSQVMELEPRIAELQRQRNLQETNYQFYAGRVEQARSGESSREGKMVNMSVIQSPSPPFPNKKKMLKLMGMGFGACAGMGFGLAFLIDLVLDRTIKRSTDVKRRLQLPVLLTIPHTNWSSSWAPDWVTRSRNKKLQHYDPKLNHDVPAGGTGIAPWNPVHHLRTYTDGLRERLITYFEVHNLTHQPKLVGVTSCGKGVGVTTLASGLAASLSMTGEGNVLLVDMNVGEGATHSFHKGRPGCGLSETPRPDEEPSPASENLYLATLPAGGSAADHFRRGLPGVFDDVMPNLKVSGYDYIVFDLPPVSQTSMTPRLSGHMDMVLLVLESETTSQHLAVDATELMRGARANVAAILNKCRAHVPAAISTGF